MRQRLSRVWGHESDEAFCCFTRKFDPQFLNYTCHLEHSATLFSEMDLQSPHCFLRVDFFFAFQPPDVPSWNFRAPEGLQATLKEGGMGPAPSKPVEVLVDVCFSFLVDEVLDPWALCESLGPVDGMEMVVSGRQGWRLGWLWHWRKESR